MTLIKPKMHYPGLRRQDAQTAGLVSYWPMWEGAGSRAQDIAGVEDGTFSAATWATSERGIVTEYASSTGISVDCTGSLNITDKITVAGWVNLDLTGDLWTIFGSDITSFNRGYWLGGQENGTVAVYFFLDGVHNLILTGDIVPKGAWHHVVGTYDGALMVIYLDGEVLGSSPRTGAITNNATGAIGASSSNYEIEGQMDGVAIWNRGLSQAEVKQLFQDPYRLIRPTARPVVVPAAAGIEAHKYYFDQQEAVA